MRLTDAPVIVTQFHVGDRWFRDAAAETRKRFANPPEDQEKFRLKKLDEDIWAIDGPLGLHVDKTRRGFEVIGLVLFNDPALYLVQGQHMWDLPPGTVFHIDGRASHGAVEYQPAPCFPITQERGSRAFGFMAWDVHRHEDLDELVASIPDAMEAYAAGRVRVDVSRIAKPIGDLKK